MAQNGYNPLRWNCEKDGCFNKVRRPKIEEFAECFPGSIALTDVDGVVEINGKLLFLEWKTSSHEIPTGQAILFERLFDKEKYDALVLVVDGDASTMEVRSYQFWFRDIISGWKYGTLEDVKRVMRRWVEWAVLQ